MGYQNNVTCSFIIHFLLLLFSVKGRAKIPAIIAFGDSTVDAGNNNYLLTVIRGNFKPYGRDFEGGKPTGRFSNGRLATDYLSDALGIKPSIPAYFDPNFGIEDFATGVTFASSASGYDNLTSKIYNVLPLWKQLEYFKDYREKLTRFQGKDKATETLRKALYIISIGTDDFVMNYFPFPMRRTEYNIPEYEMFLVQNAGNFVKDLYNLGARKISMIGSPPMGCLPVVRNFNILLGRTCFDYYNKVSIDFNTHLKKLVDKLRKELDGIQVVFSDIYKPMINMTQNPHLYGFEEVKRGCCGTGMIEATYLCMIEAEYSFTCKDPSIYMYFDAIHATDRVYGIVADSLLNTSLHELI